MITDLKFNEAMFTGRKIADLSDTPSSDGMSAADLKAYFDYIPKTMIALGALNSLIDALVSSDGAGNIGASVSGVTGTQVQPILESMKAMLDDRYTKEAADSLFSAKADNATVNAMVKSIEFDQSTGVFTITRQDGTTYTLDTLLEKLAVNFVYDSATQSLLITLSDGTTQTVPLSDFITDTEIKSTDTINVTETGGVITLNIKSGSITDDMLSSALLSAMQGYVQNCATSASNAGASANNAKTYSDSAAESASSALVSKNSAVESASSALASKNSASTSETNAAESVAKAQAAQAAAEKARDEAQEIVGGDYATKTELSNHTSDTNIHITSTEKSKLSTLNAAIIVQSSVPVATSAWASDTTYTDYPYRASIVIDGCTANHIPEVTFALSDATSGNFAPITETYDGGVYIYAIEQPSEAMTIPTIKLTKVVS